MDTARKPHEAIDEFQAPQPQGKRSIEKSLSPRRDTGALIGVGLSLTAGLLVLVTGAVQILTPYRLDEPSPLHIVLLIVTLTIGFGIAFRASRKTAH